MSLQAYAGKGVVELVVGEVLPVLDTPGRPWEFDLFERAVDVALGIETRGEAGRREIEMRPRSIGMIRKHPKRGKKSAGIKAVMPDSALASRSGKRFV